MGRKKKTFLVAKFGFLFFLTCLLVFGSAGSSFGAADDVLLGVASSQDMIDPSTIDETNFDQYFDYNGTADPSLTIGGNVQAQIGAIWTGGSETAEWAEWRQILIVIDSNGDGNFTPFDWGDLSNPWNRPDNGTPDNFDDDPTTWDYTYPDDYPEADKRGQTITMTWSEDCWCVDGFPHDTFQWWWYEQDYDKTESWWMESGKLMNTWWEGRDQNWNMLPNGNYKVKVWVDENDDMEFTEDEANRIMVIAVETASITGIVVDKNGDPIEGARIEASSHMAWGETRSKADGSFIVSGLEASPGLNYFVRVMANGKVTNETEINLEDTTASTGEITLQDAISITGTIKLNIDGDEIAGETEDDKFVPFTNQWGWEQFDLPIWIDTWNMNGPGWGNTNVSIQENESSINFTINIPPPGGEVTYQLNVNAEGYASSPVNVTVNETGGSAGIIVIEKASILTGTVRLPEATTEWNNIDVQAISVDNNDVRYWGWGNIDPYAGDPPPETPSTDMGQYRIDGIPAGTYTLEIRVMGYMTHIIENVVIAQGQDKVIPEFTADQGKTISGTIKILGDTTDLQRWQGDESPEIDLWIDAWSNTAGWSGTNVMIDRGVDQQVNYKLSGLSPGTFEINCWIGDGYELVDGDGNAPVFATVSENVVKDLVLKGFEGVVRGVITGPEDLDLSKVVVEVKKPWDWLPPKIATVANNKIDPQTGEFEISGLGTGDYIIKAGMYTGFFRMDGGMDGDFVDGGMDGDFIDGGTGGTVMSELPDGLSDLTGYNGDGFLMPDNSVGVVTVRTFVQNDASNPTVQDIAFSVGYSISGTVSLSSADPPWHDFGDGQFDEQTQTFGDPNGKKDTSEDPMMSEAITMAGDVIGQPVYAMPMEMMFMGGEDPRMGMINEDGTFQIDGLAPGVYIISPPFSSNRISMYEGGGSDGGFDDGEEAHHWTVNTQMVVITDSNITEKNFVLGNGYTISGTLTMPEAQTINNDWEEWDWVGQLELATSANQYSGHSKSLMKGDFNNSNKYDFTFNHVANGDYMIQFWTEKYVPGIAKVTVSNSNASVNVSVEEGANLVGKLIDAETGEAVTSADGIKVMCEAFPYVEGSWRETRTEDTYALSYIEDDSGLKSGGDSAAGEGSTRENKTPGKFHLSSVKTGQKYVIYIEAYHGKKTQGAKNYVGKVIADIEVPEGATGDIDVGTIKLTEGTTIKGRLTDENENPIPGVEIFAIPSNSHDGTGEGEGISDTKGYYTIYGVSPEVEYYDLIAAERPFMFDDWGKQVQWGEKRKYNIAPGSTDINFTLYPTTATLSGTVTVPTGVDFMLPFKGEGEVFPAAYILLQKKGVVYKDTLDGLEGMTTATPSGTLSAEYTVDNIVPGSYNVIFMNYGLPTKIIKDVMIEEGNNNLDIEWASAGYTVSGGCTLSSGGYPSSSDISGVICMNTSNQSLIFGELTEEADGTFSDYEVPGLEDGQQYQLAFYQDTGMDDMPDVFPVGTPFTVEDDITRDAIISRNIVPILMTQSTQDPNDETGATFKIGIFSTSYLTDKSISVVETEPDADSTAGEIYVKTGTGLLSNVMLSGDKRNITATYTANEADIDVSFVLAVHYGSDATTLLKTMNFNVNTEAANSDVVNVYTAGQVKLGNGDASQIYVPAGSIETSDNGKAVVVIEKTDEQPGTASVLSKEDAGKMGIFAEPVTEALPEGVTAKGKLYDFSVQAAGDGATASVTSGITVQLEYDDSLVDDVNLLDVWHLVNGSWVRENVNKIIDVENKTISAEVSSLSPFIIAEAPPQISDDMSSGWVLMSLTTQPSNTAISSVLSGIAGKYVSVWAYNGGWELYDPEYPDFSELTTMAAGKGYWINMSETGNISVSGSAAVGAIQLSQGWNLVGFNSSEALATSSAISSISEKVISVWTYGENGWELYDPEYPDFSELTSMEPGKGYWINTTGSCTWILP